MRGDIRNIRIVAKGGAFGDSNNIGVWIYGRRHDGRTVPCKNESLPDGGIQIFSDYVLNNEFVQDVTSFSGEEWRQIWDTERLLRMRTANQIIDDRVEKLNT